MDELKYEILAEVICNLDGLLKSAVVIVLNTIFIIIG